jgi:hypothetical protein
VTAVVHGEAPARLARQMPPAVDVLTGPDRLERAAATDVQWLWLISAGGTPRPDALDLLLRATATDGERRPALVCGIVLDDAGRPVEEELPPVSHSDVAAVIRLCEHRLAPVRHATFANCLIERTAFERHGLPDSRFGRHAAVEWTARVLGERPGLFCPASVVIVGRRAADYGAGSRLDHGESSRLAAGMATIRMVRSGAWTRGESARGLLALVAHHRSHD